MSSARRRAALAVALAACLLIAACFSPVPQAKWPVKDDPLFASAVWIEQGAAYGSGAIIHSSKEHGTFVLTAGHMLQDDDGWLAPNVQVQVGVYAPSHAAPLGKDHELYEADVVATTIRPRPPKADAMARFAEVNRQFSGDDLALLRLRTDRLFKSIPIYRGEPAAVSGTAGFVVAVAPEMYPHRLAMTCAADRIECPKGAHGNSGAPAIVNGEVVGAFTYLVWGPGPSKLQAFLRGSEATRFLLDRP
jgi:hypothetical protein